MSVIAEMFTYPFMQRAFIVGALVALCSALLGVSLVLKRYSMIGDGLSHVGFGALALATVFASSGITFLEKIGSVPVLFSVPIVLCAAFFLLRLSESSKLNGDSAIAVISTASFAFGVLMISLSTGINTDIFNYMFGSVTAIVGKYVPVYIILAAVVLVLYVLFYNRLFAVTFDEDFARASGSRVELYKILLASLTAVTVVVGMKMIGTMLITALIVLPPLAAMRLFSSFRSVVISSAVISVVCCIIGITASYVFSAPAGASIVAVDLAALLISAVVGRFIKQK